MQSALKRTGLLLLALTLASSPLLAAEGPARPGFFASLWRIVTESVNEKLGSGMDPDGLTAAGCRGELGSIMDPNGCPTSASSSDRGSGMDPNGRD